MSTIDSGTIALIVSITLGVGIAVFLIYMLMYRPKRRDFRAEAAEVDEQLKRYAGMDIPGQLAPQIGRA